MIRTALAILAILAAPVYAESGVTFDAGYADCRFTPSPDGQWWQKDQQHSNRYKAGCGTLGFSAKLNPAWTAGIHFVSLGRAMTNALAVACDGDDCSKRDMTADLQRAECRDGFKANCLYQWRGAGRAEGVNFSLRYHLFDMGAVRIEAKGGAFAHRLAWNEVVEPMGCMDNCSWRIQIDQRSRYMVAPMGGVVASWGYLYASWEVYGRIGEHSPVSAGVKGPVEVKTIGVMIPL